MILIFQNRKESIMKLKSAFGVMSCFCAVLLFSGCENAVTADSGGESVKIFQVGPAMEDCVGVGPMTCLLVKQPPDLNYQMFYSAIKGFDYVPGYEYELKVKVNERENVPADASKYEYQLVEVVAKNPAGPSIDNTAWVLENYISVSGTMDPVVEKSEPYLKIADGKATGNTGANNFFGGVKVEGTTLEFSTTGSTMMMGTPELMAQENQFLKLLGETADFLIVGEELRLRNAEQKVLLVFVPRMEVALISPQWKATGINNGKGGVQSLLAGTTVTAIFGEDRKVSGSSGCNKFSGTYERDGNSIKIGPLAGTRMMCAEPGGIMQQETQFLKALENASTFVVEGKTLELRDAKGALQVKFAVSEK
ncbi:META domain-containing protein [Pseudomonadota bacterium]